MHTVLITGGTGALGAAVTARLIAEGYACIVPYRQAGAARALRELISPQQLTSLLLLEADMTLPEDAARVFEAADAFGELFGLVHLIGGIRGFQAIQDTSVEDWQSLLTLNLTSFFLSARLAMQRFSKARQGRIVSISAMGGVKPSANQAGYGVSKAGVIALTKILADEGRSFGVTSNCIAPGIIRTDANLAWGSETDAASWVTPAHIATCVAQLLGSDAASINGSVIQLFGELNV